MQNWHFKTLVWCAWAGFAGGVVVALLANALGWATWIADLAVAIGFTCALPMLVNQITLGLAGRLFARQHHRRWWLAAYVFALMTVCSRRVGWPDWAMMLSGALALFTTVGILLSAAARRRADLRLREN